MGNRFECKCHVTMLGGGGARGSPMGVSPDLLAPGLVVGKAPQGQEGALPITELVTRVLPELEVVVDLILE